MVTTIRYGWGRGLSAVLVCACGAGLLLGACGAGEPGMATDGGLGGVDADQPVGDLHQFVARTLVVPTSDAEGRTYGFDLDLDANGTIDNKLATIMAAVALATGSDPQLVAQQRVVSGDILHLLELQATSLETASSAGLRVFIGEDGDVPPDPVDNFSGLETFTLAPGTPTDSLMIGDVALGVLSAGPGTMPLELVMSDVSPTFTVWAIGARVTAELVPGGLVDGKLGGAIPESEIQAVVYPALAQYFGDMVAADCPGGSCVPSSPGAQLLEMFDSNEDGAISVEELQGDPFVSDLLAPDLDLVDSEGFYAPNVDGIPDSLSLGVGFHAVSATFTHP